MFRVASHVPSPTYIVFEEYVLLPGGDRLSVGAMTAMRRRLAAQTDPQFKICCVSVSINRGMRIDLGCVSLECVQTERRGRGRIRCWAVNSP